MTPQCPDRETLSAYLDREANPSEEKRVDLHLAECSACRGALRLLSRMKVAVRNQPLPPMPVELRTALGGMVPAAGSGWGLGRPRPDGPWRRHFLAIALGRLRGALADVARPAWVYSTAAAAVAALAVWTYQVRARTMVPVDLIFAAHNQYALTMPLAATEKIMADMPVQVSYAGGEELPDAY